MDSPFRSFQPNLQGADIAAAGERRSFDRLQIAQKCVFVGTIIPSDGDVTEPYWDRIEAKPAR
jgi:hypothetical protein